MFFFEETVVRWGAAKGIGKITMRVPLDFGDEIVANVVELMHPSETMEAWHGACLCIAELVRRGIIFFLGKLFYFRLA